MRQQLKESLSALMDGEANELEIQRLLSCSQDKELENQWRRYLKVKDCYGAAGVRDDWADFDISSEVSAVLVGESPLKPLVRQERLARLCVEKVVPIIQKADQMSPPDMKLKRWGAAIAGLGAVFLVGMGVYQLSGPHVTSSFDSINAALDAVSGQKELPYRPYVVNEDQAQRLGDLLLRHAGNGFMGSGHGLAEYARVASYDPRTL